MCWLLFHAVPRRGASLEWVDVIFLSSLAPPSGSCRAMGEIFVGYTQPCLRVVRWGSVVIPLVGWGLCFGKVAGVISCLVGPVQGYRRTGPVSPDPSCLSIQYLCCNSLCRGLGSVCYIWSISPVLSCVNLSILSLILFLSFSLFPSFFLSVFLSLSRRRT